jgi:hypothetical protein
MIAHLVARFFLGIVVGASLGYHYIYLTQEGVRGNNPNAGLALIAAALAGGFMLLGN